MKGCINMIMSLGGAAKSADSKKFLKKWGKCWKSGDHAIVIYGLLEDCSDVVAASVWGHNWDMEALGTQRVFYPTLVPLDEMTGEPKIGETDILYRSSKLFKLYFEAAKAAEENKYKGKNLSEAQLKKKLAKIEAKYKKLSPVVGSRRLLIATECVYVPMVNDAPDVENIAHVSQDVSPARAKVISKISKNPQYYIDKDLKYIAVTYDFDTTNDRMTDGKVAPEGLTADYALHNRFPEIFEKDILPKIEDLPHDGEIIAGRHSSFAPGSPAAIQQAIQSYAVVEAEILDELIVEGDDNEEILERFKWNFAVIDELGVDIESDLINDALDEAREEAAEKLEKKAHKDKVTDEDDDDDKDEKDGSKDVEEVSSIEEQMRKEIEDAKNADIDYEGTNDEKEIVLVQE